MSLSSVRTGGMAMLAAAANAVPDVLTRATTPATNVARLDRSRTQHPPCPPPLIRALTKHGDTTLASLRDADRQRVNNADLQTCEKHLDQIFIQHSPTLSLFQSIAKGDAGGNTAESARFQKSL